MRIDRLETKKENRPAAPRDGSSIEPAGSIEYSFSVDPETRYPLTQWENLGQVLKSIGSRTDRAVVRFSRSVGDREIAIEVLGAAALDRLVLRWSDTGLKSKASPPWYFTTSKPTGLLTRVPLGEVPANFYDLSPEAYEGLSGLDIAAVPQEAVVTADEAAIALSWFLATWPDESSPILEWNER